MVTGATTGIGAAIAGRLAAHGAHLVLVARSVDRLNVIAATLRRQYGVTVHIFSIDLGDKEAPGLLAKELIELGVEIELLVNNAGTTAAGPVAESDPVQQRAVVDLNAGALTQLTSMLLPGMVSRGHGSVINIASTGAYQPAPYLAAYAASKAYVLSFTQAVWAETRHTGVRVVAVSPGPTETAMNTRPARGKRQPGDVADTALQALRGSGPAVIDGGINALVAHVFSRLVPTRPAVLLARAVMARNLAQR